MAQCALAWRDETGVFLRSLISPVQACFPVEQGTEQGLYRFVREYTDNRRAAEPGISFAMGLQGRGYADGGGGMGRSDQGGSAWRTNGAVDVF